MKTLLITGTTGFIGQNILKFIKENYENEYKIVLLSSKLDTNYETILHNNYTFSKNDFFNKNIDKIDVVLHIGAFTPKSGTEANDIEQSNANILNTKYLYENLPNTPSKFIFLSTLDVYGKIETIISESSATNPLTMYGHSKLYCERMLENWASENKVVLQLLRVGHIYGKGEEAYKKVIPITIERLKNGLSPQLYGAGDEKRSFLHVDDVSNLIMKSIELQKFEGVINLCSSNSNTIKEIVVMLIEISKKNIEIDYVKTNNRGIDFEFDTLKMNDLLGYEKISILDGLTDEYYG